MPIASLEVTFRIRLAEVAPGKWIAHEVRFDPPMEIHAACDIAMLVANELELRRVQHVNDPKSRPEIPLGKVSKLWTPGE